MLVAFAVSGVILTVLISFIVYAAKSFAGMENYVDLEQKSQLALDTLTREIRETQYLTNFGTRTVNGTRLTNQLIFVDSDGYPLTYHFTNNILLKQKQDSAGNVTSSILLTNVDYLSFLIFQRNPVGGSYDQFPTTNSSACKLISVSWVCSRSILGSKLNTESVQTAKIVIRKQ
jgi:hypothetical protein